MGELELLKKPEARETAAFDPTELQGLIAASRMDDDLALPVEPAPALASSNTSELDEAPHYADMPESSTIRVRIARGSERTPKAHTPLKRPVLSRTTSLMPWILVALAAAAVLALALWR